MSHRHCWIIPGPAPTSRQQLSAKLAAFPAERILWCDPTQAIQRHLGRDYDFLVFDAHPGFSADLFAAAVGTLCGGGVCCILLPTWADWPTISTGLHTLAPYPLPPTAVGRHFMTRVRDHFNAAGWVRIIPPTQLAQTPIPTVPTRTQLPLQLTAEQTAVVAAVQRVALGHARRPLVLSADRGRGKSTALGVALAQLLATHPNKRVVIIAPHKAAVHHIFQHIPHADQVQFFVPDTYLQQPPTCDMLVIDEAAALPLAFLTQCLQTQNRIVFSSTVQGYEGSGRGFALRFNQILHQITPHWRALTLTQPMRWQAGDRLEHLLHTSLLLALTVPHTTEAIAHSTPQHQTQLHWVSQATLAQDEALLQQVLALLISAHYQTRPRDLHQLLDAPGRYILLALQNKRVVGVLVALTEGGLDATLSQAISVGKRRPQGHLLVQSIAYHAGLSQAPRLRILRIQRIAVAWPQQRQGIGSQLVQAAKQQAQSLQCDGLGVSCALADHLLAFWQRFNLRVLHIGQRRDPASGAPSMQLLNSWTTAGAQLMQAGHTRFQQQLPWRLGHTWRDMDADCVARLMYGRDCTDLPLHTTDLAEIQAISRSQRQLADGLPTLWRWYCHQLAQGTPRQLNTCQQQLLLRYVLQQQPIAHIAQQLQLAGKKAVQHKLRSALQQLAGR